MKKINFVNKPNTDTPINDINLNKMQKNIEEEFSNLEVYSTKETFTGKYYTNGEKIYKKTYDNPSFEEKEGFDDIIFETNTNIHIINSYGSLKLSGFTVNIPTPDAGFGVITNVQHNPSGLIYINKTHDSYGELQKSDITIEYIKINEE